MGDDDGLMRLPGKPDDDGMISGAPYAVTQAAWDEVGPAEPEYDRTDDYADLASCIGCGARINPGPVRCPLCAGELQRPAA